MPSYLARTIYYSPADGKNLNRVFPGRADGTLSERIALVLTREVIERATHVVDLHCGDGNESLRPYTYWITTGGLVVADTGKKMAVPLRARSDRGRSRAPLRSAGLRLPLEHGHYSRQAGADDRVGWPGAHRRGVRRGNRARDRRTAQASRNAPSTAGSSRRCAHRSPARCSTLSGPRRSARANPWRSWDRPQRARSDRRAVRLFARPSTALPMASFPPRPARPSATA